MSTVALLLIALAAVAVLLVLVIKIELPAFVSLLLVSMGTTLATGIPLADVVPVMVAGMGKVLGSVAIVVGLGSMLGRLIEVSGGADHLARTFTEKLGQKRVVAALTIAAFILGIPVFFDVGFIILAPIVFGFAKVAGLNPLKVALPVGAVLLTVHVTLPPHPGPVAAAAQVSADVGLVTLIGLAISAVVGVVGFFVAKMFRVDTIVLGDSPASEATIIPSDEVEAIEGKGIVPGAGTIVGLILLPTIVAAFVISAALRAAQGSATVAILTTAGLLSSAIATGGYSPVQIALITLAIGFGGLGLSHINDSGFWIVTKYLGLSVADGLKTWTVLTTVCGIVGFLLTWGVFQLV